MKIITANKLNRLWKNGVLPKLGLKIDKTKVLTTIEQVLANTNAENIASAVVVKALNNTLAAQLPSGIKLIVEGSGASAKYYAQLGADTTSKKKLGNSDIEVDIRVKTSGTYPSQSVVVSISYDNKATWKNILSLSLDCHSGGSAFSTTKSTKYTVTAGA